MAFSQATMVKRIRTVLNDNPYIDTCVEAMDTTEVGLDVTDGTEWQEGDVVEFSDDGERCYVQSVSSNTLTVIRNYQFSVGDTAGTGTTHAINTVIYKNPIFPYQRIIDTVHNVLHDLWPYVYRKLEHQLTPSTTTPWYNLTAATMDISSVYQLPDTTTNHIFYYGMRGDTYQFEFVQDSHTSVVASGVGLYIPYLRNTSNTIFVNSIARIDDTTSGGNYSHLTEGVEVNAVVFLAVAELIATTDVIRTTQDDVSMGDQSVRPLTRTQLSEYWRMRGLRARRQWELHLNATYPRYVRKENRRGRKAFR